jgi:hypothetical protein
VRADGDLILEIQGVVEEVTVPVEVGHPREVLHVGFGDDGVVIDVRDVEQVGRLSPRVEQVHLELEAAENGVVQGARLDLPHRLGLIDEVRPLIVLVANVPAGQGHAVRCEDRVRGVPGEGEVALHEGGILLEEQSLRQLGVEL